MAYKVAWTEPASLQFDEILAFVGQHNPAAAARLGQRIVDKVRLLAASPLLGSIYSPAGSNCRETLCGNYRIFYRIKESEQRVEILAVWHAARQEPDLHVDD